MERRDQCRDCWAAAEQSPPPPTVAPVHPEHWPKLRRARALHAERMAPRAALISLTLCLLPVLPGARCMSFHLFVGWSRPGHNSTRPAPSRRQPRGRRKGNAGQRAGVRATPRPQSHLHAGEQLRIHGVAHRARCRQRAGHTRPRTGPRLRRKRERAARLDRQLEPVHRLPLRRVWARAVRHGRLRWRPGMQ